VAARRGEARARILDCAESLVREHGGDAVSVEAVAKAAGSAKGLVHYHFKTKQGLLSAVAERLAGERTKHWVEAFDAPAAHDAVQRTWALLTKESADGTVRAWQSLVGVEGILADGLANRLRGTFADVLCGTFNAMLREQLGLVPTIPDSEIGLLLEAVIDGMGFLLTGGTDAATLEGAYSAAWLGILSLTQPTP
jgi:AcrR family transcriptional regulator